MDQGIVALLSGFALCAGLILSIGAQNAVVLRQGLRREHVGLVVLVCVVSDAVLQTIGVAGVATLVTAQPWLESLARWAGAAFILGYALLSARRAWRGGGSLEAAPEEDDGSLEPNAEDADGSLGSTAEAGGGHGTRELQGHRRTDASVASAPAASASAASASAESAPAASPGASAPAASPGAGGIATRIRDRSSRTRERSTPRRSRRATTLLTILAVTWLNPHALVETTVVLGSVAGTHGDERWWFLAGGIAASTLWFVGFGYGARFLAPLLRTERAWRILDGAIAAVMVVIAITLVTA